MRSVETKWRQLGSFKPMKPESDWLGQSAKTALLKNILAHISTSNIGNLKDSGEFMGKRFTDTGKWRNSWFRGLPLKAKIVWTYLCDECDFSGIWKADYGLASYQVDFKFDAADLWEWFGEKVHFFSQDQVLIVQFYEFQYGESKDSWTAKVKARERLEALGFSFSNNKILLPTDHTPTTVVGQSDDCLSVGVGVVVGVSNINTKEQKNSKKETEAKLVKIWNENCGDLPTVRKLSPGRDKKASALFSALTEDEWVALIRKASESDFLTGKTDDSDWVATFDWFIGEKNKTPNYIRVLEGHYDKRKKTQSSDLNQKIAQSIKKFGSYNGADAKSYLGDDGWEQVKRMGGWAQLCRMSEKQIQEILKG